MQNRVLVALINIGIGCRVWIAVFRHKVEVQFLSVCFVCATWCLSCSFHFFVIAEQQHPSTITSPLLPPSIPSPSP